MRIFLRPAMRKRKRTGVRLQWCEPKSKQKKNDVRHVEGGTRVFRRAEAAMHHAIAACAACPSSCLVTVTPNPNGRASSSLWRRSSSLRGVCTDRMNSERCPHRPIVSYRRAQCPIRAAHLPSDSSQSPLPSFRMARSILATTLAVVVCLANFDRPPPATSAPPAGGSRRGDGLTAT